MFINAAATARRLLYPKHILSFLQAGMNFTITVLHPATRLYMKPAFGFAPPFPSLPLCDAFWGSSIWHKCVGAPWCNHVPTDGPMHRHTHLRILKPLKSLRNRAFLSSLRLLVSCALLFQFGPFRFWRRPKGGSSQYWRGSKRTGLHNAREHLVASVVTSEHHLSQCSTGTLAFVEMTALSFNPVPGMTNSVRCLVGNSAKTHKLAKSHKSNYKCNCNMM